MSLGDVFTVALASCGVGATAALVDEMVRIDAQRLADHCLVFDDAVAFMRSARSTRHRIALVSNCAENTRPLLERLGLHVLSDAFVLSCELGSAKPGRHIFDTALASLDVAADCATLIDDQIEYCRGARSAGSDAIHLVRFDHEAGLLPVDRVWRIWDRLRSLPRHPHDTMAHGDLIPGNIVLRNGRLAGLLDLASYGAADPALDLIVAWHLFDDHPRAALRERLGCGDVEWRRGMAWALQQSVGLVWYYESTNPSMSRMGRRTLERIVDAD